MDGTDSSVLVWLRRDLRLRDHPALAKAAALGIPVIPVFVWPEDQEDGWTPGAASRWWLHHSLAALDASLRRLGSRLIVRRGRAEDALSVLAAETGAQSVFWNRSYEPAGIDCERRVSERLAETGIRGAACDGNVLFEPGSVMNASGKPFQVFTPFWRACLAQASSKEAEPAPEQIRSPRRWPSSLPIDALGLLPSVDWAGGLRESWEPGEDAAWRRVEAFAEGPVENYSAGRDVPSLPGTSRLSPYLHFGEISVRELWRRARELKGEEAYLRQLAWREFARHLLFHFPDTPDRPLRREFENFPWRMDEKAFRAWREGRTGYPLVDAGMRELWHTGWMHNRVRMVVASFLVKHLLIGWQEGAAWFWDTLVDADLANNTLGWQWTAGCGADAAPYFRIFNPVLQGEKFDPEGRYVRRWVPELARVPDAWVHQPWEAPPLVLAESGVRLGRDYPQPIVDHDAARKRALAALASMKAQR